MMRVTLVLMLCAALVGCGSENVAPEQKDAGVEVSDAGSSVVTCTPCLESSECGSNASCVQYAGSDFCGHHCNGNAECGSDEVCMLTDTEDGTQVSSCVPANGTCGESGCGTCDPGDVCDRITGLCSTPDDLDGGDDDLDAGDFYVDAGSPDAGGIQVGIGPDGGQVPRFIFAVIGDTRPPASNDTAHYPVNRVNHIYDLIQGLNPRPQFVVTTGDYMFATASGPEGKPQMDKYVAAMSRFDGPVFGSMGNHECSGGVSANCAPAPTSNNNYKAFVNGILKPIGKTKPYYEIPFNDTKGTWTAKLLVVACNAWSAAQKTWLETALKRHTDYTFVARHEPMGSTAPCNQEMDALLKTSGTRYTMLLVGHVHNYNHSGKQLLEGCGGAPLTGSANFGFATITQRADGDVRVRQYDSTTGQVVSTYTLPPN